MATLEISAEEMRVAFASLPADQRTALEHAAQRVRAYHERQKMTSWSYREVCRHLLVSRRPSGR